MMTMSPLRLCGFALGAWLAAASLPASAFLFQEEEQRQDYLAALQAVRSGDHARLRRLRDKLDGYPLCGYLDYEVLKDRLSVAPSAEVGKFLDDNAQAAVADPIRRKWLRLLAARGDWDTFLRHYRDLDDDPELACLRLGRLLATSEAQVELMREVESLWLTGKRLPSACEPVFAAWKAAGHMSAEQVWERIRLAMERRNATLAAELARYLEPRERVWVNRWIAMHRDPLHELERLSYPVETPVARMIVKHGIVRLAARDPELAVARWEKLKARYSFYGEDDNYVLREAGILAAQDQSPQALKWLSQVVADPNDEALHLWRVRTALRAGDWEATRRFIAALPESRQRDSQWSYWKARALEVAGQPHEATQLYRRLARTRDYYGFLAADRLDADYAMQHAPVEATPEEVSALLARPGIQMAQELFQLGLIPEARRQWNWVMRRMNNRELAVAAVIAREWGWHDRAILTVSKSDHLDDLELRFPVLYREQIETNAQRQGLDPGWIYGVVRQESAFVVDARSPVGALGLMQLMPATGRLTGQRLNLSVRGTHALLDVENNLKLGASYLKEVLGRARGNQTLATASYNAGPNRVNAWLPREPLDAEVWVETIPFNETRDYVKNVLAFAAVYDHRLGVRPVRLQSRMPPVAPVSGAP
jgi:soluble lytic murein transglycosylase